MTLYLIQRGPQPRYQKVAFHPVIICDRKRVAVVEMGMSDDRANVWVGVDNPQHSHGWILRRWRGLDIDYGHTGYSFDLFDGTKAGIYRDYDNECTVKHLFAGAIWWSDKQIPAWLVEKGVLYPSDNFSQMQILDTLADDGIGNCDWVRTWPEWWAKSQVTP